MKVIIATTVVPFVQGGAIFFVDWLEQKLQEYGHQVELLKFPFHSVWHDMPKQMLALRLYDIGEYADCMIAVRTPSYLLRHPNKRLWFIHHHRDAYDYWGTSYQIMPDTDDGLAYRKMIIDADQLAFQESKKIFTNSQVVSDRLLKFNNVASTVLYPPLFDQEQFFCRGYGDFILYCSRIENHKRQWLAVEAMRYTKTNVKLVLAGVGGNVEGLQRLIDNYKLYDKVQLLNRWISEEEKVNLFADCLASIYCPFDEDSYGYPSLESYAAKKAVITATDSGGVLELITDRINGIVSSPDPKALAGYFDELYLDRKKAEKLGLEGYLTLSLKNISWDHVINSLLN